jgi:hypothetical protein
MEFRGLVTDFSDHVWPSLRSARIVQPWRETLLNRNLAGGHKLSQVLRKPFYPTTLVPIP